MSLPTKRDWEAYEQRCRKEHVAWLRSLTPAHAFALYEDFHRFAAVVPADPEGTARIERQRWVEKVACRQRMVEALLQLDRARSGRRDSPDVG